MHACADKGKICGIIKPSSCPLAISAAGYRVGQRQQNRQVESIKNSSPFAMQCDDKYSTNNEQGGYYYTFLVGEVLLLLSNHIEFIITVCVCHFDHLFKQNLHWIHLWADLCFPPYHTQTNEFMTVKYITCRKCRNEEVMKMTFISTFGRTDGAVEKINVTDVAMVNWYFY